MTYLTFSDPKMSVIEICFVLFCLVNEFLWFICFQNDILFPLYDLPLLLSLCMSFSNGPMGTEMSRKVAEKELSKDVFLYTRGFGCR